jgi:transposase-like protein
MYTGITLMQVKCPHCEAINSIGAILQHSGFPTVKPSHKCKACNKKFYMQTNCNTINRSIKPYPEISYEIT